MTNINISPISIGVNNDVDIRWRFLQKGGMAKTKHIGVRLDPGEREALERAAAIDDRSMAALVRKIVAEWLRAKGYLSKPC